MREIFPASTMHLERASPSHYEPTASTTHSVYTEPKLLCTLYSSNLAAHKPCVCMCVCLYINLLRTRFATLLMLCMICQITQQWIEMDSLQDYDETWRQLIMKLNMTVLPKTQTLDDIVQLLLYPKLITAFITWLTGSINQWCWSSWIRLFHVKNLILYLASAWELFCPLSTTLCVVITETRKV